MKLVPCIAALASGALLLGACADDQLAADGYDETASTSESRYSPDTSTLPATPDPTLSNPAAPAPGSPELGTSATLPPGATRNLDGTITYPDGSVRAPDGTLVSPSDATIAPSDPLPATPPATPAPPPN